jgi:HNH endonuclease
MNDLLHRGWRQAGPKSFDHHCGARVSLRGGRLWTAKTLGGNLSTGHLSAEQACEWVEVHDPDFWTYGSWASSGNYFGIEFTSGNLDKEKRDNLVVCSIPDNIEFPPHLTTIFKRRFLENATCARCGERASEIMLRPLPDHSRPKRRLIPYVVCSGGHPVWRIPPFAQFAAGDAIAGAERSRARRKKLKEADGKHTQDEICAILKLQENRCIYCNVVFTEEIRWTRDHLLPIDWFGSNWATNIVLACQSCNSRRSTIPFRTYCKALSPTQNRRVLRHLDRRIRALDLDTIPKDAFAALVEGIGGRYPGGDLFQILRTTPKARRNVAANRLLPSKLHLILRRASVL